MNENEKMIGRIQAMCVDNGEGCLIWKGSTNQNGIPMLAVRTDGKRKCVSARRVLWEAKTGRKLRPSQLVVVKQSCRHPQCMTCLELSDRAGVQVRSNQNPAIRAIRASAAARTRHLREMKLDWDKVRRIRSESGPARVLAAEFGVSAALVRAVRANTAWRDTGNVMSFMAGALRRDA